MIKIPAILLSVLILININFAQGKNVDNFPIGEQRVEVYFYDPLLTIVKAKDFHSKSDKEKSQILDKYLRENPLYLFRLADKKTGAISYLCVRGKPEITEGRIVYKVEYIKGVGSDFDPDSANYADKIVQTFDLVNIMGTTLFEHMSIFDGKKNMANVGVEVFGYYRRIQPYREIRDSIVNITKKLSDK